MAVNQPSLIKSTKIHVFQDQKYLANRAIDCSYSTKCVIADTTAL